MGLFTIWRAVFYDNKGEACGKKKFSPDKPNFKYDNKSFIVDLQKGTYFKLRGLIWDTRYYHYQIDNPHPFSLEKDGKFKPAIDSDMLNIQLESKVARDLNRLGDKKLSDLLTPRNLIIGAVILIFLWVYLSKGGISAFTGQ